MTSNSKSFEQMSVSERKEAVRESGVYFYSAPPIRGAAEPLSPELCRAIVEKNLDLIVAIES